MAQDSDFLSPAQVVTRWGSAVTTGTLANWRCEGKGPPFQKFGSRVRYPFAHLVEWERQNTHQIGQQSNDNNPQPKTDAA